jgi:hypothetical protein
MDGLGIGQISVGDSTEFSNDDFGIRRGGILILDGEGLISPPCTKL